MGGSHSRTKGHNFERWVARELRKIYPQAKRGLQNRVGSAEAPDVEYTPWWIECKRLKKWSMASIRAAFKQARKAREIACDTRPVLVVFKADNDKPLAYFSDALYADHCLWDWFMEDHAEYLKVWGGR